MKCFLHFLYFRQRLVPCQAFEQQSHITHITSHHSYKKWGARVLLDALYKAAKVSALSVKALWTDEPNRADPSGLVPQQMLFKIFPCPPSFSG